MKNDGSKVRQQNAKVWATLLVMCMAQYLTVREKDLDVHFYNASVILCGGILALLFFLLPRDEQGRVRPLFGLKEVKD